jgi:hypothetical protein
MDALTESTYGLGFCNADEVQLKPPLVFQQLVACGLQCGLQSNSIFT